ncbi:PREDICTED: uncharacterized protein LOC106897721 [Calidris pugnax]|uniref:uncharacterized protein LOC106897721 n=1 Tax=Calidris pugnax TaxID=198806 RepID=UPI00071C3FBA|nr:PREDICTED: uncharacterized protein LOC106897721 [Calidris pugnax]
MAGERTTLLFYVLVAAAGALPSTSGDIARVTWRTQETHIAEAKPKQKVFTVDYLPRFRGRLLIHPTNLSLEMGPLELEDSGFYNVVVDTFSDPTNPKTFSYFLLVYDGSTGTGDSRRHNGSTVGPWGTTEPCAGDATTQGEGGGQPPGGGGGTGRCGVWDHYCVVKGWLVATIFGPLLILVVAVHVVTRDKATKPGEAQGGPMGCEPPGITAPRGPSPWW